MAKKLRIVEKKLYIEADANEIRVNPIRKEIDQEFAKFFKSKKGGITLRKLQNSPDSVHEKSHDSDKSPEVKKEEEKKFDSRIDIDKKKFSLQNEDEANKTVIKKKKRLIAR